MSRHDVLTPIRLCSDCTHCHRGVTNWGQYDVNLPIDEWRCHQMLRIHRHPDTPALSLNRGQANPAFPSAIEDGLCPHYENWMDAAEPVFEKREFERLKRLRLKEEKEARDGANGKRGPKPKYKPKPFLFIRHPEDRSEEL